jgi:tetratricopeptide (TPR) repeat protein
MKKFNLLIFCILFFASCKLPVVPVYLDMPFRSNEVLKADTYIEKGEVWYNRGCYTRSLKDFLKAHELFSGEDNQAGVAESLNNIGNIHKTKEDFESALAFYQEAFDIYSNIKDYKGSVQTLANIAAISASLNRFDDALDILNKADMLIKKEKVKYPIIMIIKGIILTKQKQYNKAKTVFDNALQKIPKKNYSVRASLNFAIANLMFEIKNYDGALKYLNKTLEIDHKIIFYPGMAEDLFMMGKVMIAQNKTSDAVFYLKRSVKIYALMENVEKTNKAMQLLEKTAENNESIIVTKKFVNNWLNKEIFQNSCY